MRGSFSIFMGILIWTLLSSYTFAENRSEEVMQLGQEAIEHYDDGELDLAIEKFNRLLLANPNDEQALKLRQMAGLERMTQMLVKGGEMSRVARAIFLHAEKTPIRQETSTEVIQDLVYKAASGNAFEKNEVVNILTSQVGERAIPYMLPYLANEAQYEERINVILAITRMGSVAVVPLTEVLKTSKPFLKQQVLVLLGHLKDVRALPDVKKVLEDPNADKEIKRYAEIAIGRISKRPSRVLPPARQLYFEKALGYYREKAPYTTALHFSPLDWRWEEEQLVSKQVPRFAYNEIMAEHACFNAIELDPTYQSAWALLVQVTYAQDSEVRAIEESSLEKSLKLPASDVERFAEEKEISKASSPLVASAGARVLNTALLMSLQENRPEVTAGILEDLGTQFQRRRELSYPMLRALQHKDKRIRYAAAEALVKMDPPATFRDADQVMKVLAEALNEWDARVVLIIEDDDSARNQLIKTVRDLNMVPLSALTGAEGLQRAQAFPPEDMVIVSSSLRDLSTAFVVNSLKEDYRTNSIPVVVVSSESDLEQQKKIYEEIDQVKSVISKPLAAEIVKNQLQEHIVNSNKDYKGKAQEVSRKAAEALASLPANGRVFKLELAEDALIGALRDRHDVVRSPAIMALGKLGRAKAAEELSKILYNSGVNPEIRMKAAWALGQINGATKREVSSQDVESMLKILAEAPSEDTSEARESMDALHAKVFTLLGKANILFKDRHKVFLAHRLHKNIGVEKSTEETFEEVSEETTEETSEETIPEEEIWEEETSESSEWEEESYDSEEDSFEEDSFDDSEEDSFEEDSFDDSEEDSEEDFGAFDDDEYSDEEDSDEYDFDE